MMYHPKATPPVGQTPLDWAKDPENHMEDKTEVKQIVEALESTIKTNSPRK
jgi:hypothetical protein